jgi:hypothetical protein
MFIKYTKRPKHIPHEHKIPTFFILRNTKFTQIGIFGFKIYHLATLRSCSSFEAFSRHSKCRMMQEDGNQERGCREAKERTVIPGQEATLWRM